MSAIDRAFAKVYAKEMLPLPADASAGSAGVASGDNDNNAVRRTVFVNEPHTAVPAPHVAFVAAVGESSAGETRTADDRREDQGHQQADRLKPDADVFIEPAFEVDRFAWPDMCRRLLDHSTSQLSRLVELLRNPGPSGDAQVVLVVGCQSGEGRTTLLLSLALMLADKTRRVALVDGDFANARLAEHLGISPRFGIDDVLSDGLSADEAMIESVADRITLVPLREAAKETGDLNRNPRLPGTLAMLRRQYDILLVAGRPLADGPAAVELRSLGQAVSIDMAVLVHDRRITSATDLQRATDLLQGAGIESFAVVENFFDSSATQAA